MQGKEQYNPRVKKIDGVEITLQEPDRNDNSDWIGQSGEIDRLECTWRPLDADPPMNSVLVSKPGVGKTYMTKCAAKRKKKPYYRMNCDFDMKPDDLVCSTVPVKGDAGIEWRFTASPLVSAMLDDCEEGAVCNIDEATRMDSRSWQRLVTLLECVQDRYIQCNNPSIKIHANPKFCVVFTMNFDEFTEKIPENMLSRLNPLIEVPMPSREDLTKIVRTWLPKIPETTVLEILQELKARSEGGEYSTRDAIDTSRLVLRGWTIDDAVSDILKKAGYAYGA